MTSTQEEYEEMKVDFARSVANLAKEKFPDMSFILCCTVQNDEECKIACHEFSSADICSMIASIFDRYPGIKKFFSTRLAAEALDGR